MAYEHNPGTATLFRNKDKKAGDNLPDYKGEGKDEQGNSIELAGWVKESKKEAGQKYLFVKISQPRRNEPQERPTQRGYNAPQANTDDMPF